MNDALQARRVLIAEDAAANAILFTAVLERAGFIVDIAPDGRAAVEQARRADVGLILMDLGLPILDGVEAARRIRAEGGVQPIFALTAEDEAVAAPKCREAGMDGVLTKPLSPARLVQVVAETLGSQSASSQRRGGPNSAKISNAPSRLALTTLSA